MTGRVGGFYWVRFRDENEPPEGTVLIASWPGWYIAGHECNVTIADADVLAGPLQAPTFLPGGVVVYDNRMLTDGDVARMYHARLRDLRSRARALLEGTTPGPWHLDGGCVFGSRPKDDPDDGGMVIDEASFKRTEDIELILGAHALLTELAKEGV